MPTIKVGMLMMPQMLREILYELVGADPAVELIDLADGAGFSSLRSDVDVLLVPSDEDDGPTSVWPFLAKQPDIAVLALNRDARLARLFEFHHEDLGEPSAESLIETLHRVGRREKQGSGDD